MGLKSAHVRDDLLHLAERRLAPDERQRVQAHLAVCPACRAAALDLDQIVDDLQALPRALQQLDNQGHYRAARTWPAVWDRVRAPLTFGQPRPALPHVSLYVSLVTAFCGLVLAFPGTHRTVLVTADLAQTPLVTMLSTATYGQPPVDGVQAARGLSSRDEIAATSAGTAARQPIPIPTPVPGPRG